MANLQDILRRYLVKIGENWDESHRGLMGRIGRFGRSRFIIGFKTENESLTLTLDKEGNALLGDESSSPHNVDFEGSEKDILAMLANGGNLQSIPPSIRVRIGGQEFRDGAMDSMAREGAAKKLRDLLR